MSESRYVISHEWDDPDSDDCGGNRIVWDIGELWIVVDNDGLHFGVDGRTENESIRYGPMGSFEDAQEWCFSRLADGQ